MDKITYSIYTQIIALYTLSRKEIVRIIRIWKQTILPIMITTSLYFIIFGKLIGNRIGIISGEEYINFIIPGLVMLSVIQNSYINVVSSFFGSKFQKSIEEMIISPMVPSIIISGFVLGGVFRGLLSGAIVLCVFKILTDFTILYPISMFFLSIFTAILFSLAGFLNGMFANKFDDISIIPTFILTPMIYLGGVFYSADMLYGVWKKITYFNPIFYITRSFRYCMFGIDDFQIEKSIFIILVFITILYSICVLTLKKKDF